MLCPGIFSYSSQGFSFMNSLKSFSIPCLRSKKELDELVKKARTGKDPNDSVVKPPSPPPSNPVTSSVVHVLSLDSTPIIQDSRFREQLCGKPPDPAPSFESVLLLNTSSLNQPIRNSRNKSPSVPPLTIKRIAKSDGSYNYQVSNHMLPFITNETLQIPHSNLAVNVIDCSNVHTYGSNGGRPSSAGGSNGPAVSLEWINDDPYPSKSHSIVTLINEAVNNTGHRQEEQLPFPKLRKRQNDAAFDHLSKRKKSYERSISSRETEEKKLIEKQTSITRDSTQGKLTKQKGCDHVAMATRTSLLSHNSKGTSSNMVCMEPTVVLPSIKNRPLLKTTSTENITETENHTHNTVHPVDLTHTNDHAHNKNHHYGNNKGVSLRSHTHKTSNINDTISHTHNPVCIDDHASADNNKDNSTENGHTHKHHDSLSHTHDLGNDNVFIHIPDTSEDNESVITINIDSPIIIVDESDITDTPPSSLTPPTDDGILASTCNGLTDLFKRKSNSVALNTPVYTDRNVYHAVLLEWQVRLNRNQSNDVSIIVENTVDMIPPPLTFNYISENIYSKGVPRPDPMAVVGCSCTECNESSNCCPHMAGHRFPYYRNGKLKICAKTPIYECNNMCACGENCSNRVVQKGSQYSLCIFRTHNGRGWGVKTCCPIEKGRFVMEYVGEVITFEEAERRGKQYDKEGATYLFDLDYDSIDFTIDATLNGNVSHFLNHSCDPNLVVFSVWIDTLDLRLPRLALFARRDIDIGEELTFDYQMNYNMMSVDPDKRTSCLCGTKKCRKYLF